MLKLLGPSVRFSNRGLNILGRLRFYHLQLLCLECLCLPQDVRKKNSDKILNPFTPKSVWLIICPYSITLESNVKVTRLKEIISNSRSSRLSRKFPCQYYRKCLEDSVKNINAYVRHEYGHVPTI